MMANDKQAIAIACELKHIISLHLLGQISSDAYNQLRQQLLEDIRPVKRRHNNPDASSEVLLGHFHG